MNDTKTIEMLRTLRLTAMADVFETSLRLGSTQSQSLGELVAHMTEAEWSAREQRRTERLLKQAALRILASLEEIEFSKERNLERGAFMTLASMDWVRRGATVLITAATGAGKTFIACALGHEACLRGISVRYIPATKLFPQLRIARGEGSYAAEIKRLAKASVLIIDDFGLSPLEHDDALALLEIPDDRYHKAGTIVTSQRPVTTWHELITEPTIGDAVMDRLAHTPYIFQLKGGSRRRKHDSD